MKYFTLGYRLPRFLAKPLFGDRTSFGPEADPGDPCWREWQRVYLDFYYSNQKRSVGAVVNNAGYRVMSRVTLAGKRVLEIGPGDINHLAWWRDRPDVFVIADIQESMLERSRDKLVQAGIPHKTVHLERTDTGALPLADEEFDIVISFYSLEHLYPLRGYLRELLRVLKPGGLLIGAIPAEGGLGWGLGRLITSRRWLRRHTQVDPDKIICWEHPNFADGILRALDQQMLRRHASFWPLGIPSIDLNLVIRFVYEKR